ncbi:glycoside hydrolase family 15 protein [Pelotalea chapellei]|uniref:Glycoside hydrolase family 15 protein n=1 Tax=Pelotalea chapellei TaxID=44671 RepID=A0ABS5U757_9BACT|nr:glycoside hydrolase family 15 protein [Pelotalea chapellei]MBT1071496.1 glycoside hydrolase family 15 protein [Pelotalea chapellei]
MKPMQSLHTYPAISDYGFIADCHSAALVSREGSIDWCCMPRIDSSSCFGRLLDWESGGFCKIAPAVEFETSRCYLQDTLVLETQFHTGTGDLRLIDLFSMCKEGRHKPHQQLLRIIEGIQGEVALDVHIVPRFEYGAVRPWIRKYLSNSFIALAGCDGLLISGDILLHQPDRHCLMATVTIKAGERRRLSLLYRLSQPLDDGWVVPPDIDELDQRLEETLTLWRTWAAKGKSADPRNELINRSALVLKGLSNAATGAIAAAATTSLPEAIGGIRNWDYRFSWVRDSVFTVHSLAAVGYPMEADGFRRFIERSAAGSADELQIMFGVGGERRLEEYEVQGADGYCGSRPVRIGNAAFRQLQLDIYGELLDLAWRWHQGGQSPDDDYWAFLKDLVNEVGRNWRRKDQGIWEMRGRARHFVFSKVMCWSAVDKGIALAEELGRKAPLECWYGLRNEIRNEVENLGYDKKRGIFVQYYGAKRLDAALLRMPMTGFIAFDDPRMVRTVDAISQELGKDGLVLRYASGTDGFKEPEGAFLACSFWLAECLSRQGRREEAHEVFEKAMATGNDLGLFSEQFDTCSRKMLGNFPQGLTHLSFISAAMALDKVSRQSGKNTWKEIQKN